MRFLQQALELVHERLRVGEFLCREFPCFHRLGEFVVGVDVRDVAQVHVDNSGLGVRHLLGELRNLGFSFLQAAVQLDEEELGGGAGVLVRVGIRVALGGGGLRDCDLVLEVGDQCHGIGVLLRELRPLLRRVQDVLGVRQVRFRFLQRLLGVLHRSLQVLAVGFGFRHALLERGFCGGQSVLGVLHRLLRLFHRLLRLRGDVVHLFRRARVLRSVVRALLSVHLGGADHVGLGFVGVHRVPEFLELRGGFLFLGVENDVVVGELAGVDA